MILGAKNFVNKIRKKFLPDIPHNALPQQKQLAKNIKLDDVLKKSAKIVKRAIYFIAPKNGYVIDFKSFLSKMIDLAYM